MTHPQAALNLDIGQEIAIGNAICTITRQVGFDAVLVRDKATNQTRQVAISELKSANAATPTKAVPALDQIDEADLKMAQDRLAAIQPLLTLQMRSKEDVTQRAKELGHHTNTLYGWLRLYEGSGLLTSLLPKQRKDKGARRLSPEVEAIVAAVLDEEYLRQQRRTPVMVYREITKRCRAAKLTPPHANTLRNRIKDLPAATLMARRYSRKKANMAFTPSEGEFPGAPHPLAVVQMDHTKLDIILVDDHHRRPIGRPWITLAVDVFSRMVLGLYISFDPPGALSTGLCIANAILPKENLLTKMDLKGEWPCWGVFKTVHLDNAKEFRGKMLERACRQYGINVEWRPVAQPNFGGDIERLNGTIAKEVHALPGTTFSNTAQRGEYDSEGKAALTLSEFEVWLTTFIVQAYHQRLHSSIGMTPLAKFREGVFGNSTQPGSGLPARIADIDRLRLDFMPFEERTIQDYGVAIDKVHYFHDVLRPWVNAPDRENPKKKRVFTFRRDPRDISTIWFYDPELRSYSPIPYRDTSRPAISVWELREAQKRAEESGAKTVDEAAIFAAYDRMREIEIEAKGKTKAARRSTQRRNMGIGATTNAIAPAAAPKAEAPTAAPTVTIQPFDEMDDLT